MARRFGVRLPPRYAGLLGVVLAGALGVRLLGVGRGLPYIHEWDEPFVLSYVIGMLQRGDLNPAAFTWPSVYYYMLLPVAHLHYWYLHARGVLMSPEDIRLGVRLAHPGATAYWWSLTPSSFYLWGRVLTALVGTATVFLVYRIGKTVYSPAAGLLAAAMLALAPGAIYYSDTVRVDIPMAFFVTLTILAGLGIIRRGQCRDYIVSGLLAGIAISTKQDAAMVILPLLVAHVVSPHRTLLSPRIPAMGLCVLAGVVIGTPYLLITPRAVIEQAFFPVQNYGGIPTLSAMRRALPEYLAYFVRASHGDEGYVVPHIAMGLLPAVAAVIGLAAGFRRNHYLHIYLLSFALPFLLIMSGQRFVYLRSMMPVLPFEALFAGAGCMWVWSELQRHRPAGWMARDRALATVGLIVLLAVPMRDAVALGWTLGHRPDTRTAAVDWLRHHAPRGSNVAVEQDLHWDTADLGRLPVTVHFAPRRVTLGWYFRRHIDFAVVQDRGPLRRFQMLAVFARPPALGGGGGYQSGGRSPIIDPTLYVVEPRIPSTAAVFPVELRGNRMIAESTSTNTVGVYTETVHLPDQRFVPGSYTIAVVGGRPVSPFSSASRVTAQILVNGRTAGTVTVGGAQPLRFMTLPFRIGRAQTVPVQVRLTYWTEQWAFRPSATNCAMALHAPALDLRRLTVEAWVYPEGMNEPPGTRMGGGEPEGPVLGKGKHLGYYLRLVEDRSGKVFADLSVAGKFSVGRAGFVPFRKWTHIAATYDGHEARIYLNGVQARPERDPRHEGTVRAQGFPFVIGCRDPGQPYQMAFKGFIAGVRVWDGVLPPDAIRNDAKLRPNSDAEARLVGSWSFQSLADGVVPDLSGMGNDLTVKTLVRVPVESGPVAPPVRVPARRILGTVKIERVAP